MKQRCPQCGCWHVTVAGDGAERVCGTCQVHRIEAIKRKEALSAKVTGGETRPPIQDHPYSNAPQVLVHHNSGRRVIRKSEPMGG